MIKWPLTYIALQWHSPPVSNNYYKCNAVYHSYVLFVRGMSASGLVILVVDGVSPTGQSVVTKLIAAGHTVFSGHDGQPQRCRNSQAVDIPIALDVCCDNSVAAAITHITKSKQRIDVIVNNHRDPLFGAVEAVHIGDAEEYINKMLVGTMRLQKAVLPIMRAQGCGRIVNFNTQCDDIGAVFTGWHAAIVAALKKLTDAVNEELTGSGVTVVNVSRCLFNTQSARRYLSEKNHQIAMVDGAGVVAFNRHIQAAMKSAPSFAEDVDAIVSCVVDGNAGVKKASQDRKKTTPLVPIWHALGGTFL